MNDSVAMAMVLGFIAIGLILANRKLKIAPASMRDASVLFCPRSQPSQEGPLHKPEPVRMFALEMVKHRV